MKHFLILLLSFTFHASFSQQSKMTFLTPDIFKTVKQYIHDKGDSVTMNISSRTDKFVPITYHFIKRNGYEIDVDASDRIYFMNERKQVGNIYMHGKIVETEIPEGDKKSDHEKIVLREYNLLVEEVLKSKK